MSKPKSDGVGQNAQNDNCNSERKELGQKLMDEWEMVRRERDEAIKREPENFVNLASAASPYGKRMSALQQQRDRIWDMACQEVRRLNAQLKKTVGPGIHGFQPPDIDLSEFMEWLDQGTGFDDVIWGAPQDVELAEFEEGALQKIKNNQGELIDQNRKAPKSVPMKIMTKATLSIHSQEVLTELLRKSGQESAIITSVTRTPEDQARIMFDKLEGKTGGKDKGVDGQKALYGKGGDSVIEVYIKAKAMGESDTEIKRKMVAQIYAVGPSNVSKHCADPSKLNAIDIDPKSIKNRKAFEEVLEEAKKNGVILKYLKPPLDAAYHIEILQPSTETKKA